MKKSYIKYFDPNINRKSQITHHNRYDGILFKERVCKDVIVLCYECHEIFHSSGRKVINHYELKKIPN